MVVWQLLSISLDKTVLILNLKLIIMIMKQIFFFSLFVLFGLVEAVAQDSALPPDEPDFPIWPVTPCGDQFTVCTNITASVQWKAGGIGEATVVLPFSLDYAQPTYFLISTNFSYSIDGKNLDFVFFSSAFNHKVELEYEDQNYSYGYVNTASGHSCFAYKVKYKISITFI